jgi:UDP-4-amino-4,6-dideoxy-N-acetyl-beta-L-altrosamine transaminase
MIPYGRQQITEEDLKTVVETLKSDYLTQGPKVAEFEKAFADFCGSKYAVAVSTATSALHLCALALDVKPGQKVLCTPNTFVASSNCILYCGGDVEFVDINPETFCLDTEKLKALLEKSKPGTYAGVVAVDFAGYPMDFKSLRELTKKHGLWLIEDAAHAPGAEFQDSQGRWHRAGNGEYANLTVFSFHPVKHIATGEGGMITTNSKELYEQIARLRTHGITKNPDEMTRNDGGWYMEMQDLGWNYRIPDVLCALGISQLKRIDPNLKRRRELAQRYQEKLKGLPLKLPVVPETVKHSYHLFVIQTEKRKELYDFLKTQGIYAQVHYIPIYQQPYYQKKYGKMTLPNMENYYAKTLSLPMYHAMTNEEQDQVITAIKKFYA